MAADKRLLHFDEQEDGTWLMTLREQYEDGPDAPYETVTVPVPSVLVDVVALQINEIFQAATSF